MDIKSLRIRSYKSFKVDEHVPEAAGERYRRLQAYQRLRAAGCSEAGTSQNPGRDWTLSKRQAMKRILGLILVLILFGCATPKTQRGDVSQAGVEHEAALQKELYVRGYLENQIRVSNVAYPILTSSADTCDKKVGSYFGVLINSPESAGKEYRKTFKGIYGSSDDARIVGIVKNSPAQQADVKIGDSVQSIAGKSFTNTSTKGIGKMTKAMHEIVPGTPTVFRLGRNGRTVVAEITPVEACGYPVTLMMDDTINAFADGKAIYITKGMMRFAQSDNELALVIGHELAHNAMLHINAKKRNYWLGTIFDIIAAGYGIDTQNLFGKVGINAYSQAFESEADYVGLYYVARSGYDMSEAPAFWRRMGAEHPGSIKGSYNATHPSTSERFVQLEQTVKEILAKQESGEPLAPNMKPK